MMKRKPVIAMMAIALWGVGLGAFAPSRLAAAQPAPNIVVFLADDMGLGDTSAYQDFTRNDDSVQIHTPQMERLARRGVRFLDAHTPSSRCSPTRYSLLTGRYAWRSRLKHWVLFGSQGDPMIEPQRPTLASSLREHGYRTYMVGKWHVGLRYRQTNGQAAAGWEDADLTMPMFDTPLDHGFDECRFTSRSHGTSGPNAEAGKRQAGPAKRTANGPRQSVGPGHIHGRQVMDAVGEGKRLGAAGEHAYRLHELGGRHSDNALEFLQLHAGQGAHAEAPFFLYYASNSNHGPYTPDSQIGNVPVAGAARTKSGESMNARGDFVHENDVALGRLLDFLATTSDPRNGDQPLIQNTIVVFTSDNGAERKEKVHTGPFRSHKGSAYEGGHRVPFLVSWPQGGVGEADARAGADSDALLGLQDLYATLLAAAGAPPNSSLLRQGGIGGEDSVNMLAAWRGKPSGGRAMFFNDHKETQDHAACAFRWDDPSVDGKVIAGQWKLFCDAKLLRFGVAQPLELYDLRADPQERENRMQDARLAPLVRFLSRQAVRHRTAGSHQLAELGERVELRWAAATTETLPAPSADVRQVRVGSQFQAGNSSVAIKDAGVDCTVALGAPTAGAASAFHVNPRGLGVSGGEFHQVESGEWIEIEFGRDVLIEAVAVIAGNGVCGGYCQVGDRAPVAIYCVDGDIDANDQSGLLSDLGVLRAGQKLRVSSAPHLGVETPGRWRLGALTFRPLD